MTRIQAAIDARRDAGRLALVPFLTAGYPDQETSVRAAVVLAGEGADVLEIGIPFSDPVADGPIIQRASDIALGAGMTPARALEAVAAVRAATPVPILVMTYLNPAMQFGRRGGGSGFAAAARRAGADGVIFTDLPPDQAHACWQEARAAGLDTIVLVTPSTSPARLDALAKQARGFVYCVQRLGVTGPGGGPDRRLEGLIAAARRASGLPVAVGFGIDGAAGARAAAHLGADAVVVGSAFLARMGEAADPVAGAVDLARDLIAGLAAPSSGRNRIHRR